MDSVINLTQDQEQQQKIKKAQKNRQKQLSQIILRRKLQALRVSALGFQEIAEDVEHVRLVKISEAQMPSIKEVKNLQLMKLQMNENKIKKEQEHLIE